MVFAGYALFSIVMLVLLARGHGRATRPLIGGIVDLGLMTFIIHFTGSVHTPFIALYVVATMIYALAISPEAGAFLSLVACVFYTALVVAEQTGILPYAPGGGATLQNLRPSGVPGAIETFIILLMLACGSMTFWFVSRRTRDRERHLRWLNDELAKSTRTDPLTGVANRRHLEKEIRHAIAWARRGRVAALLMIDLDGFKGINDNQGHLAGDQLLVRISDAIRGSVREVDLVGRYGGDEFMLILHDTDLPSAAEVATRVVESVRSIKIGGPPGVGVTASVGLAVTAPGDDEETLVERADRFAYEAKSQGGDGVCGQHRITTGRHSHDSFPVTPC